MTKLLPIAALITLISSPAWSQVPNPCPPAGAPSTGTTGSVTNQPPERRSEEHTSELQSHSDLVCRLLLEKKKHNHTLADEHVESRGQEAGQRRAFTVANVGDVPHVQRGASHDLYFFF